MEEGLYKVTFETQRGHGTGVVALRNGRVDGGDTSMFYTGTYSHENGQFNAELRVAKHTNVPGIESVLGVDSAILNLSGAFNGSTAQMRGTTPQAPGVSFQAILTKIAG